MLQSATLADTPAARRRATGLLGLTLILLTLALALPAGASALVSAGGGWSRQSSGTTAPLYAVAFSDAAHGRTVSHGGAGILATTSGGGSSPTSTPPGDPVLIWEVGNIYTVYNGGASPTVTQGSAYFVTSVRTYHWNNGKGAPAGQITLKASDGTVYGPWQATGIPGQGGVPNASWEARPQQVIPAGAYTVIDSDPSTWSQNSATNGKGMCSAYGIPSSTPTPPPTGGGWSMQSSGTTANLYDVAFSGATHGWAVGHGGAILATTDGGSTWSAQSSGTTASLMAVAFSDATHGWAVGYGGAILTTTNGGATWSAQSSGSSHNLFGVAFPDATHGWAVGSLKDDATSTYSSVILATTDGGATWIAQSSWSGAFLLGVAFPDATHGWAVGDGGAILATTDGGATWSAQSSPTTAHLKYVAFSDATHGWAVGWYGAIVATTNGGATWSAQSSGTTVRLVNLAFPDATHGWAVGWSGVILATTDGGGAPVIARLKVSPPFVPSRVRAGAGIESWGTVRPALTAGRRIQVFWEHYIDGRWQMVKARAPADSYDTGPSSTRYSVRFRFAAGKWRVHATAWDNKNEKVTSAVRRFTAY